MTQTASRSVQPFLDSFGQITAECPIIYNGTPLSPQNYPFPWGIWTPSNTWFRESTQVLTPIQLFDLILMLIFLVYHFELLISLLTRNPITLLIYSIHPYVLIVSQFFDT